MDSVEKLEAMAMRMEEEEEEEEETLEERYWDVSRFLGDVDLGILSHVSFDPTTYESITKTEKWKNDHSKMSREDLLKELEEETSFKGMYRQALKDVYLGKQQLYLRNERTLDDNTRLRKELEMIKEEIGEK